MKNPILILSVLLTSSLLGFACAHTSGRSDPQSSSVSAIAQTPTLVLIQGVHLDGSSWDEVKKHLGPELHVITLDRLGRDTETPATTHSIAQASCETIPSESILIGHSYGGAIANEMFGICSSKIKKIVYVSAVVPIKGEKPFDVLSADNQKTYGKAVDFKKPKIYPKNARKFFSVTDHQVKIKGALPKLYPEWISIVADPVEYDIAGFEMLPKAYIFTTKDPVITLETQRRYVERSHILKTDSVATGHFPMISDPEHLSRLITQLSR